MGPFVPCPLKIAWWPKGNGFRYIFTKKMVFWHWKENLSKGLCPFWPLHTHTHTHNHDTYYTPSQKSPNLHHYTYMDLASVIKPSFWSRFDANTAPKMRSSWAPKMLYRPSPLPKIPFIPQKHGQLWSWQGHALVHINNWIAPCPPCSCSCLLVYVHGVW